MSLKNTPSSENPEENKFPEKIKENNARNKTFQEIAKLEGTRNTKERTNYNLSKLQTNRLKGEIAAQQNPDNINNNNSLPEAEKNNSWNNHQDNHTYTIAPSNMTLAQEDSLKWAATAIKSVGGSCINACLSLAQGLYNTPQDLKDLLNGTATYDRIV